MPFQRLKSNPNEPTSSAPMNHSTSENSASMRNAPYRDLSRAYPVNSRVMKTTPFVQALGAALLAAISTLAAAQAYPSRPVTVTVPFAAGGPTDTIARIMAERMSRALGQTVVVENVVGAGGTIAGNKIAHAAPDGYSITIGHVGTHVIAGAVQKVPYDVFNDFEPVAM